MHLHHRQSRGSVGQQPLLQGLHPSHPQSQVTLALASMTGGGARHKIQPLATCHIAQNTGWCTRAACCTRQAQQSLAERNRQRLALDNVTVLSSHWFSALADHRFDLIISNPPYIAAGDVHLAEGDVRFEPESALVAGPDGLDDIREIVAAAPQHLNPGAWLMLEHGYDQGAPVRDLLQGAGFTQVESRKDLGAHERITLGRLPC